MGRQREGATIREGIVAFRLNAEETDEFEANMADRGITDRSAYLRTLIHEDSERRQL